MFKFKYYIGNNNKKMNNTIILVALATVFFIAIFLLSQKSAVKDNFIMMYSEPNLSCQLGNKKCTLSTGHPGKCNISTRKCIELSPEELEYSPDQDTKYHLAPALGEVSEECQWRTVCNRSNNEMGVCMSGLCYPETFIAR